MPGSWAGGVAGKGPFRLQGPVPGSGQNPVPSGPTPHAIPPLIWYLKAVYIIRVVELSLDPARSHFVIMLGYGVLMLRDEWPCKKQLFSYLALFVRRSPISDHHASGRHW